MIAATRSISAMKAAQRAADRPWRHLGLPDTEAFAHEQPQIESGDVEKQPLGDVLVVTQMSSSHAARFECIREGPFDDLATWPHQLSAAGSVLASAVRVDGVTFCSLAFPILALALRLGAMLPVLSSQRSSRMAGKSCASRGSLAAASSSPKRTSRSTCATAPSLVRPGRSSLST